jgi:ABC-type glycerol-3-phosphate transport system substrate-binding protein
VIGFIRLKNRRKIMKKTKWIFILMVLFSCIVLAFACTKDKRAGKIRLMHWGGVPEIKLVNEIIADIKKEKGIDVVQERAPSGNPYMEKVITQAAAGYAPDVLFVEVGNFKEFVDRGLLIDLTPYIKRDKNKDFNIKNYYPQIIDRFTLDGKLYVIPRDIAPMCVIYYNKKMFDEAGVPYPKSGWTWKEFLETAKKLTKKDANGRITQFGFLDEWPIWEAFAYSNGGSLVDDVKQPKKCVIDSPEVIEAVQFRADMINKYKVMPAPYQVTIEGSYDTSSMFMAGKVAMFYSGIWKTPFFRDITSFDWDVVMFPKGPKGKRAFPTGGSGYAITSQCKNKGAAWEVVKRLSGEQGQADLANIGLLQPAIMKLAES